jgi:hypothetical protein
MEDNCVVDTVEKFKWSRVLTKLIKNPDGPQGNDQLVACPAQQYDLATYLWAVDSCLASTMSTQGDHPLSRCALIDSPLDKSSWDHCLTFSEIEGCLMWHSFPSTRRSSLITQTMKCNTS